MKKILGFASLGTAGAAAIFAMSLNAAPTAAQEVMLYKIRNVDVAKTTPTICAKMVSR